MAKAVTGRMMVMYQNGRDSIKLGRVHREHWQCHLARCSSSPEHIDTLGSGTKEKSARPLVLNMWNFFGNFSHPPGTYYSNQSKLSSPMWYMYDQVIISQEVLPWFRHSSLKIITATKMFSLMDKKGCPNKEISDHFPIVCEIDNQMFS